MVEYKYEKIEDIEKERQREKESNHIEIYDDVLALDISGNAKILLGLIRAMAYNKGFCWATNLYLAKKIHTSERTITRLLTELQDNNLIYTENYITNKYGKPQTERRIFLSKGDRQSVYGGRTDVSKGVRQECLRGLDKSGEHRATDESYKRELQNSVVVDVVNDAETDFDTIQEDINKALEEQKQDIVTEALKKYAPFNVSSTVEEILSEYNISDDLKVYAIKQWVRNNDGTNRLRPTYLQGILKNIQQSGATTVEEFEKQRTENKKSNSEKWLEVKQKELELKAKELDLKEQNRPYYQKQIEMQSGKVEQKKQEEEKNKDYFKLHDAYIKGEISREEVLKSGIEEVSVQFWDAEIFNNTPEEIELQKKWEEHLKKENEMKKERKKW